MNPKLNHCFIHGPHALVCLLITLIATPCLAQEKDTWQKWYVGMSTGIGWLQDSRNGIEPDYKARYALAVYAGARPTQWMRIGVNFSGWTIEPYGNFDRNPEKGIGISNNSLQVQLIPFRTAGMFINTCLGFAKYINHHPDEFFASGKGCIVGIGYEKEWIKTVSLSFTANYAAGKFDDVKINDYSSTNHHYRVFEIRIGAAYIGKSSGTRHRQIPPGQL